MRHIDIGSTGVRLSSIILGGHEYLPDGRSRGFNEDLARAVEPGVVLPGFGDAHRLSVVQRAIVLGIDTFDVTMDSEKEALARNLRECDAHRSATVQTRPEGMLYGYDPQNRKLVQPGLLKQEVQRVLALMQRDALDILNIGILHTALEDPDYLEKLTTVIDELKKSGLIRAAAADSFSGAATYLAMMKTGAFNSININFSFADDAALQDVIPYALAHDIRVVTRELFQKGELFRAAREVGIEADMAARAAIRWVVSQPGVDAVIIGAQTPAQLDQNVAASRLHPTTVDEQTLARLLESPRLQALRAANRRRFIHPE